MPDRHSYVGDVIQKGAKGVVRFYTSAPTDLSWTQVGDGSQTLAFNPSLFKSYASQGWAQYTIRIDSATADGSGDAAILIKAGSQITLASDGHVYYQLNSDSKLYKKANGVGASTLVSTLPTSATFLGEANGYLYAANGTTLYWATLAAPTSWSGGVTCAEALHQPFYNPAFGTTVFYGTAHLFYITGAPSAAPTINIAVNGFMTNWAIGPSNSLYIYEINTGNGQSIVHKSADGGVTWTGGGVTTNAPWYGGSLNDVLCGTCLFAYQAVSNTWIGIHNGVPYYLVGDPVSLGTWTRIATSFTINSASGPAAIALTASGHAFVCRGDLTATRTMGGFGYVAPGSGPWTSSNYVLAAFSIGNQVLTFQRTSAGAAVIPYVFPNMETSAIGMAGTVTDGNGNQYYPYAQKG